jgi:uncharacterized Zn-binding protein involved in type VI secretion
MPVVARKTDRTQCPAHADGKIVEGLDEVLICHKPIARKGDHVKCRDGSVDAIIEGSATVFIGGKPVALKGHHTAHGGVIRTGCPRVFIDAGMRNICKLRAAHQRAAFIRYSVQKKRAPFITPTAD